MSLEHKISLNYGKTLKIDQVIVNNKFCTISLLPIKYFRLRPYPADIYDLIFSFVLFPHYPSSITLVSAGQHLC
jgi:hypothetical protein